MAFQFKEINGPECPKCGSQFSQQIPNQGFGVTSAFHAVFNKGYKLILLQCNHCNKVFSSSEAKENEKNKDGLIDDEFVEFVKTKCRYCGSMDTSIKSTRKKNIRHHKCNVCGKNFKSKAV